MVDRSFPGRNPSRIRPPHPEPSEAPWPSLRSHCLSSREPGSPHSCVSPRRVIPAVLIFLMARSGAGHYRQDEQNVASEKRQDVASKRRANTRSIQISFSPKTVPIVQAVLLQPIYRRWPVPASALPRPPCCAQQTGMHIRCESIPYLYPSI
jgi:hypothetical protein